MYKTIPAVNRHQDRLQVRFQFRPGRTVKNNRAGIPDTKPTHDGSIQVVIRVGGKGSEQFATGIYTFRSIWDGRRAQRISKESQLLASTLFDFQTALETAHEALVKLGAPVDAKAVFDAVRDPERLKPVEAKSLKGASKEFMKSRKALIVVDSRQREGEQISPETYKTYSKRWVMIQGYLIHLKRPKQSVGLINYQFAVNFKEWLQAQRMPNEKPYRSATVNKAISFLKQLLTYCQEKGYVEHNALSEFSCRGNSVANPRPLTQQQLDHLENCALIPHLRHACDSWLIAAELCMHYADFMDLPNAKIKEVNGIRYVHKPRRKQKGDRLTQTVDLTPRAERLLERQGGFSELCYISSAFYSKKLKLIAKAADLRDEYGQPIDLQFGQGRDSGLTQRAIQGANGVQLSQIAGWVKYAQADKYIHNPLAIVSAFAEQVREKEAGKCNRPSPMRPFINVSKAG